MKISELVCQRRWIPKNYDQILSKKIELNYIHDIDRFINNSRLTGTLMVMLLATTPQHTASVTERSKMKNEKKSTLMDRQLSKAWRQLDYSQIPNGQPFYSGVTNSWVWVLNHFSPINKGTLSMLAKICASWWFLTFKCIFLLF